MPDKTMSFAKKDHVATIKLNRANVNQEFAQELAEACDRINADEDIYVVVITGSGKVFCAGGEGDITPACRPAKAIAAVEKPVIAAINGDAFGPGLEIALSCDIRIASAKARFALPQVAKGQIPADGGTQRLPRIVGRGKALEMLMTAAAITAAEALEIGLVGKVVPADALSAEAQKLAETVAAKGPLALRYLKEAVLKGMDMTLEQGLRLEADLYLLLHTTSDRTEGIKSYLEKRTPKYKGK
ncbi:MAG: enoyl-CoA hydratase/isomerase family protein [Dehalococcoidales bacterium]|nr:enoyl-CoA hydratase/isomerase family protein [Dehalococcoidales bacterium]